MSNDCGRCDEPVLPLAGHIPGILVLGGQAVRITAGSLLKRRVVNTTDTALPCSLIKETWFNTVLEDTFLSLYTRILKDHKNDVTVNEQLMKLTVSETTEMIRPCWLLLLLHVQLHSSFEESCLLCHVMYE